MLLLIGLACTSPAGEDKGGDTPDGETAETGAAWEGPNAVAPGRYVSTLLWEQGGHHCVRLAMISLEAEGVISGEGWTWCDGAWSGLAEVQPIGTSAQTDVPTDDATASVMTVGAFMSEAPTPLTGSWAHGDGDTEVALRWPDGAEERWRRTWHDEALMKLEPYAVSAADAPEHTWLSRAADGTFSRDSAATVAGFAFGGPDAPAFEEAALTDLSALKEKNFTGRVCRWNGYYVAPDDDEGVFADGLSLASVFYTTSTGVERYVFPDAGMFVFAYLSRPGGEGGLGLRLAYQISHDFDGDGTITEGGHTYPGLAIVDAVGAQRGMVYADQSYDPGVEAVMIMSAMAYLDDGSAPAQDGIE